MNKVYYPFYLTIPFIIFINFMCFPMGLFFLPVMLRKRKECEAIQRKISVDMDETYLIAYYEGRRSPYIAVMCIFAFFAFAGICAAPDILSEGKNFMDLILNLVSIGIVVGLFAGIAFMAYRELSKNNRYKKYVESIYISKQMKIYDIASYNKIEENTVRLEIATLISRGLMPNIIMGNDEVIFVKENNSEEFESNTYREEEFNEKVYHCSNCGANNTKTYGQAMICEFCGSSLE